MLLCRVGGMYWGCRKVRRVSLRALIESFAMVAGCEAVSGDGALVTVFKKLERAVARISTDVCTMISVYLGPGAGRETLRPLQAHADENCGRRFSVQRCAHPDHRRTHVCVIHIPASCFSFRHRCGQQPNIEVPGTPEKTTLVKPVCQQFQRRIIQRKSRTAARGVRSRS